MKGLKLIDKYLKSRGKKIDKDTMNQKLIRISIRKDKTVLLFTLNPFEPSAALYIETSYLFCNAKK